MICGFCGSTNDVIFQGDVPRCREWRRCWDAYIEQCDREDAATRHPAPSAGGEGVDRG